MKILIICTHFPPDTSIAAKRPYMFANYLSEFGHDVTVICSGRISAKKDTSYDEKKNRFRIIKYLSEEPGTSTASKSSLAHRKSELVPTFIRKGIQKFYHALYEPFYIYQRKKIADFHFQRITIVLDSLKEERFDVVFSTFSELSNVYAGAYAKDLFKCKWILDFRDRIVQLSHLSWLWNTLFKPVERKYIGKADAVTAISEDLFYGTSYPLSKIHTIYNGYEPIEQQIDTMPHNDKFSFCYTGMVYGQRAMALEPLFKVLSTLVQKNQIDINKLSFEYAGSSGEEVDKMASKYGLDPIVNHHGYLLPKEVLQLQQQSDIFLVLSWNHNNERGILTGKFFEGIKVKKPILSMIAGETPQSELYRLNETYHYGFCYEQANSAQHYEEFENFLIDVYKKKMENHEKDNQLDKRFIDKFNYENLSRELESLCFQLSQ